MVLYEERGVRQNDMFNYMNLYDVLCLAVRDTKIKYLPNINQMTQILLYHTQLNHSDHTESNDK